MFRAFPYALRALRRSPGFAGAAVLSPALGIVTATAFFSLADAILSRPFPVRDPDRLVALYGRSVKGEWSSSEGNQL